jgi:peptidoglycan/LPS O-acetylase OafA/YrhL
VKDTIKPLTSLRFAAAMLVFCWHFPATRSIALILSTGYAGVSFFFLLSGFILVYTYRSYFESGIRKEEAAAFYRARFARIFPVYAVSMLLALGVLSLCGGPNWTGATLAQRVEAIFAQLFFVQSWFADPKIHFGLNGPAWSLSDEAFFYALFPLIAWLVLSSMRRARTATVLAAAFVGWAAMVLVLLPRHALFDDWLFYAFPASRLFDFVIGMLLGVAFMRTPNRPIDLAYGTAREVTALVILALAVAYSAILPQSLRFSAAFMPFFGCVIYLFAFQQGLISRALSWRKFVMLGEISFAFYMVHATVLSAYGRVAGWSHPPTDFFLALSITIALSYALYRFVEEPLRAYIRFGAKAPVRNLSLPAQPQSPGFQATPAP